MNKKLTALRSTPRKSGGFTLVELLVGVALGTFVLLGLVSATVGLLRGDAVTASRMGNELRTAVYIFERDVTRAGYNGKASTALLAGPASYVNPFSTLNVATPGCVLYSYDTRTLDGTATVKDFNGVLDTAVGRDERFAFVLSGGQLYVRKSGVNHDCDVTQGVWESLLDSTIVTVTSFTPTVSVVQTAVSGSTRMLQQRTLTYSLTVQLVKDPTKTQKSTNSLLLPNDILS